MVRLPAWIVFPAVVAFLMFLVAAGCDRAAGSAELGKPAAPGDKSMSTVRVRVYNEQGQLVPVEAERLRLTDEQWKQRLTPEQFAILRSKGTERPFCGNLLDNKLEGVYACAGCSLPLFESGSKFDSGTGWPSFFQPVAKENVHEEVDRSHGMVRTEITCARCDGHLGHVFDDGPRPTGLRYCLNSESLKFVKKEDVAKVLAEKQPATRPAAAAAAEGERAEAVFAGGCFWCVEAVFEQIDGVIEAVSGYAGGSAETANYKAVCTGTTGHAEVVKIVYDPKKVSYEQLLRVHFATHDPTTLNRQGADVGTQYRSAIFYASEQEKQLAQAFIEDLTAAGAYGGKKIVTTLEPLKAFYAAEAYHQDYAACNPRQGYIMSVALPKVEKVREKFKEIVKK